MTREEMEKCYPSEWLLITELETNEQHQVVRGVVAFHSKNRDDLYRHAVQKKPGRFATLYTGTVPKDTAVIL